jgi:hypothetical protein
MKNIIKKVNPAYSEFSSAEHSPKAYDNRLKLIRDTAADAYTAAFDRRIKEGEDLDIWMEVAKAIRKVLS